MRVERFMNPQVITITENTPVTEALEIMGQKEVDLLPVVDGRGNLCGIVSERDLLYASPSPASTLSSYEMSALLSKLTVDTVMTTEVITVEPATPIEEAARILADRDITGMPVMSGADIVGIITDSDLFVVFTELFGTRQRGLQVSMMVPEKPGEIALLAQALFDVGANIISLGTFPGDSQNNALLVIKVNRIDEDKLRSTLEPYIESIEEIREC